ncbi:hypothetical protein Zmor_004323 [Zophobas morio]|jgi:hypothetical protein|uniref:Uncharacterized protein n=1 Tax=Zophobas morio TaxID=2755281 RepID=A0AA38HMU2_9CUCU|nr:hypothetical protein Zmor_004323 [Zophobas morio]
MIVQDNTILKAIRPSTAIEALHELSSDLFPVILDLGDEDTPKAITRMFTGYDKYADVLEITCLHVRHRRPLPPDVQKTLNWQGLPFIRGAMLSQSVEDKLALNQLHRCIRKRLMAHFNHKWKCKLSHISESGSSNLSSFWQFVKRIKYRGLGPLPPLSEGNIVIESDREKVTLVANVLAIQNVPAAHYTGNG